MNTLFIVVGNNLSVSKFDSIETAVQYAVGNDAAVIANKKALAQFSADELTAIYKSVSGANVRKLKTYADNINRLWKFLNPK